MSFIETEASYRIEIIDGKPVKIITPQTEVTLTNMKTGNAHVCGVYEFTSPPGVCHIPYRVMEQLWISEGENVNICSVYPEDGTYIKLKPQTTDFINLSTPKIVLEKTMSLSYPVVSAGDTISIDYNNNIYYIS